MNGNLEILREQLNSTIALLAHVQRAEMHFRSRHKAVAELLMCMSRELSTIRILINYRADRIRPRDGAIAVCSDAIDDPSMADGVEDSLERLLNCFCKYARATSERRALAEQWNDSETVTLLDRILILVDQGVWFLDIYSNALSIKCALTSLPSWRRASGVVHTAA